MRTKFEAIKAEWKKIIWPDKTKLIKKTAAVIITSLVIGLLITSVDLASQNIVNFIANLFA